MKTVKSIIERISDGTYSVCTECRKDLSFVVDGTGNTVEEAVNDFKANYEGMKEACARLGEPIEEVEFEYVYDMASFLAYYSKAFSLAGLSRITGISQGQLSHYVTGRRRPSEATKRKMQDGIRNFAQDLSKASLAFG